MALTILVLYGATVKFSDLLELCLIFHLICSEHNHCTFLNSCFLFSGDLWTNLVSLVLTQRRPPNNTKLPILLLP